MITGAARDILEKCAGQFSLIRLICVVTLQLVLTAAGYFLSLLLRFDFQIEQCVTFFRFGFPVLFLLLYRVIAYGIYRLNQTYWRYVSTYDIERIVKAHALSSTAFAATILFFRVPSFPRTVIFIELAISVLAAAGTRFFVRMTAEQFRGRGADKTLHPKPVIVLGAGESGHLLVKYLKSQQRISLLPLSVLDDNERLKGTLVHGVPVAGPLSQLETLLERKKHIAAAVCAIPSLPQKRLLEIQEVCARIGVPLKKMQAFEELAVADAAALPAVTMESVLHKETSIEHEEEIRSALKGKRVLVTGAGGSIGSELVRQLLLFAPESVILFDHSEFNMFQVQQELECSGQKNSARFVLGSILDRRRLQSVFAAERPEIVFHAAAYKHVPLMQDNVYEAFRNNVIGTRSVLETCAAQGVERFVYISTDKAVDPSSIMGCSKRIAELLVQACGRTRHVRKDRKKLSTAVVRFGNVINSTGSVIPLFKQQILGGGPITVTHPDMERYFMSTSEAVRLVLTAGTLGEDGEVYVLDMGKPIRILDIAEKMRALYGRRHLPIVFSGVRPGEKLTEDLISRTEKTNLTKFRRVFRVTRAADQDAFTLLAWIERTCGSLDTLPEEQIKNEMMNICVEAGGRSAPAERGAQDLPCSISDSSLV